MQPTWDNLQLYHVDLHFHAGTERPEIYSAFDFIAFAVATGRRIIGITDHFGRYLGRSKKKLNHYPGTIDGYHAFNRDVRMAREAFPNAIILFGPEMGLAYPLSDEAKLAFTVPVDFFICEPSRPEGQDTYGEALTRSVHTIAEVQREQNAAGILGHPLRSIINDYVGKTGPGPRMPGHGPLPPLSSYDDPLDHTEQLLDIEVASLAKELIRCDVPIEVNESSWGRILGMNHQSFAERYLFFYHKLLEEGVPVILGSDLHNVEHGAPTPFVVAQMLGIDPCDMSFLRHWLGEVPRRRSPV